MDALIRDFVSQANDYDGGLTREGQEIAHCLLSAACDPDSIRRRKVLVALGHKLDGILDLSDEVPWLWFASATVSIVVMRVVRFADYSRIWGLFGLVGPMMLGTASGA